MTVFGEVKFLAEKMTERTNMKSESDHINVRIFTQILIRRFLIGQRKNVRKK